MRGRSDLLISWYKSRSDMSDILTTGSEVKEDYFECSLIADKVIDFYSSNVAFPILADSN